MVPLTPNLKDEIFQQFDFNFKQSILARFSFRDGQGLNMLL
jgi:hypothetical protein